MDTPLCVFVVNALRDRPRRLSYRQLADLSGVHWKRIGRIARGDTRRPSATDIERLARVLRAERQDVPA